VVGCALCGCDRDLIEFDEVACWVRADDQVVVVRGSVNVNHGGNQFIYLLVVKTPENWARPDQWEWDTASYVDATIGDIESSIAGDQFGVPLEFNFATTLEDGIVAGGSMEIGRSQFDLEHGRVFLLDWSRRRKRPVQVQVHTVAQRGVDLRSMIAGVQQHPGVEDFWRSP